MQPADLYVTLNRKSGFEVVDSNVTPKQLRVVGRVPQNNIAAWLAVTSHLLSLTESPSAVPWAIDISKQYFIREGKQRYAWRIIVQATDMDIAISSLVDAVGGAKMPHVSVEEVRIQSSSHRGDMSGTGKGVQAVAGDAGVPPIVRSRLGR